MLEENRTDQDITESTDPVEMPTVSERLADLSLKVAKMESMLERLLEIEERIENNK